VPALHNHHRTKKKKKKKYLRALRAAFVPHTHTHTFISLQKRGTFRAKMLGKCHKRIQNKRQKLLFIARVLAFGLVFDQIRSKLQHFWQHFVNF